MISAEQLAQDARRVGLQPRGACLVLPTDGLAEDAQSILLLGPDEPEFWGQFTASPEYVDGDPDPMNRWSERVIGELAQVWGGQALFPFGGPPWRPFLYWAERSGDTWPSPVGLLVHRDAGLLISFRGAVALPFDVTASLQPVAPCATCAEPCTTACPVGALAPDQAYDVPRCKAHLQTPEGAACLQGCLVRRACPVSQTFGRLPEQSAFHMRAFLGG